MLLCALDFPVFDPTNVRENGKTSLYKLNDIIKRGCFHNLTWVSTSLDLSLADKNGKAGFFPYSMEVVVRDSGVLYPTQFTDFASDIIHFHQVILSALMISRKNSTGLVSAYNIAIEQLESWVHSNTGKKHHELSLFAFDYRLVACKYPML